MFSVTIFVSLESMVSDMNAMPLLFLSGLSLWNHLLLNFLLLCFMFLQTAHSCAFLCYSFGHLFVLGW